MIQADLQGFAFDQTPKIFAPLKISSLSSEIDPHSHPPITLHHSLALRPFVRRRQMVVHQSLALLTNLGGSEAAVLHTSQLGYRLTKVNFVHVYPQILMLWSNIRLLILNTI